ncbi:hypothetical protein BH11ACT3_BH11ACT3_05170 [soil metagenome]
MGLSRKRQRELKRLKKSAEDLWDEQREAIEHASAVLQDARRQAANYAREEVAPRVRDTYEDRVKPVAAAAFAGGRSAASSARERFSDDVLPAITGAVGSALALLDAAKDPRVREVVRRAGKIGDDVSDRAQKLGRRVGVLPEPKSSGPGKYILIGLGVVAVLGVAYAAWQTLRADDDLWIEESPEGSGDVTTEDDES